MIDQTAVLSSAAIPTDRGNVLFVNVRNFSPNAQTVSIRIQALDAQNGQIIDTVEQLALSPVAVTQKQYLLTDALLIRATISPLDGGIPIGLVYGQLLIQDAQVSQQANRQPVASGWIADAQPLQYPEQSQNAAWGNDTAPINIDPFANTPGTGVSYNFNNGTYASLDQFSALFTADATVANRRITMLFGDLDGDVDYSESETNITAGQSIAIHAWSGITPPANTATKHWIKFQPSKYFQGMTLSVSATNIGAADAFTSVVARYKFRPATM